MIYLVESYGAGAAASGMFMPPFSLALVLRLL